MSARIKLLAISLQPSAGKAESPARNASHSDAGGRKLTSESSKKGFTLIELMVAISIVAILSTIGMVMFSSAQGSARDAKRKGDLEDIKKAIYTLQTARGTFATPPTATVKGLFWVTWTAAADNATYGMNSAADNSMGTNLVTYGKFLKSPLHDPKCPSTGLCSAVWSDYTIAVSGTDSFTLNARLENLPPGTGTGCVAGYNYCITQ